MNIANFAIAGAARRLASTAGMAGPVKAQPTKDKCYGISLAGKNDCAAGAGHQLRRHVQAQLPGQCLEICRQGHLHQDQARPRATAR